MSRLSVALTVEDFWDTLLYHMTLVAIDNVVKMEENLNKSATPEALSLLMEAADNYHFLRQAYHDRCGGEIHVEYLCD
jgi:ABC-type transporter lipoprotein component MlaA|tara:strand:+ start:557 stop:790 length:234 start_codon:yes stop_codon:yes gene_type:complete